MITQNELWIIAQDNVASLTRYFIALRTGDKKTADCLQRYLAAKIPDVVGIEENNRGLVCKTQEGLVLLHVNVNQEEKMVALALETNVSLE